MSLCGDSHDPPARPIPLELQGDALGTWVRHWQHPQWVASVDDWVAECLAEHGIRQAGAGETYKIRFWSVVRNYPTDLGLFWFKENNPGQAFEARLVTTLAELVPDLVAAPLATRLDQGWMLTADQGPTLGDRAGTAGGMTAHRTRIRVARELARLQRSTIRHAGQILSTGITQIPPGQAGRVVRDRVAQLVALAPGHPLRPADEMIPRLHAATDRLDRLADELTGRIPQALEHNDLHGFNMFGSAETALRFFDFGDSVWAHPFTTLHGMINSLDWQTGLAPDAPEIAEMVNAYLAEWSDLADPDQLHDEFTRAGWLLPVSRLVSWHRLLDHADALEITTWIETPTHWLAEVAALADLP